MNIIIYCLYLKSAWELGANDKKGGGEIEKNITQRKASKFIAFPLYFYCEWIKKMSWAGQVTRAVEKTLTNMNTI